MDDKKYIWSFPKTPADYDTAYRKMAGVVDESKIQEYIKKYGKSVVICDLGIGTGRELEWLDKIKNISEIIGIDYSQSMLNFCRRVAQRYKKKVFLIKDDITNPVKLGKILPKVKDPIIYICLVNTFGNFLPKERKKVLQEIKNLMKRDDRLVLCIYKRLSKAVISTLNIPPYLRIKSKGKRIKLAEIIEYAFLPCFWHPLIAKYQQIPRFWYDEKENDIAIYVGNKKVFISHRFSIPEIKKLHKNAGLKIEKIIEGKLMYTVISKI